MADTNTTDTIPAMTAADYAYEVKTWGQEAADYALCANVIARGGSKADWLRLRRIPLGAKRITRKVKNTIWADIQEHGLDEWRNGRDQSRRIALDLAAEDRRAA